MAKICETCGKELKSSEVFTVNGKTQCEDCANSRPCTRCGKIIKQSEICTITGQPTCYDCAFPGGKAEYDQFKQALNKINNENEAKHKEAISKRRKKSFLIILAVFLVLDIIVAIISLIVSKGVTYAIVGVVPFFIVLRLFVLGKFEPYNPISEEDYYNYCYAQRQSAEQNSIQSN